MKKLICICVALVLALGSFCALAEEDLQAQLDAANEKIAELQAQVDAYYPFYAAQIVATYGADGVIWLEDVQEQFDAVEAQYANYGISLASYGMVDSVKKDIIDSAVRTAVLQDKAAELGLNAFDEDELAEFAQSAQEMMDDYVEYYLSYFYADAEEVTDEMRAEAEAYWADNGMNYDACLETLKSDAADAALYDYVTGDVAITEEDVEATYAARVEADRQNYANDRTYNADRSAGVGVAWNPEGYRAVKHVLIKFDDEQAQLYSDLQSQLDSLNDEKDAIENPEAADEADGEDGEAAEPRTVEEVNADIAACATEMEALYSQLLPTAEEVIAAFDSGADFDELIEKYNGDPGMQNEPTATIGYAVAENSTYWEQAFVDGAMSIEDKGGISGPVYGSNGIHIIYYMDDVPAGEVALEEIREDVEQEALETKIQTTYDDQVAAWEAEAGVQCFYENFGITAA